MIYTVTLNPALDYVLRVDTLRPDGVHRASSGVITYGGKGINVTAMLSRLGVESEALGFIGGFTGEKLRDLLAEQGLRCDFTQLAGGDTRINVKIRSCSELDVNAPGPTVTEDDFSALLAKLDKLHAGDTIVLAGSAAPGLGTDVYGRILDSLESRGVDAAVDAEGELLLDTLRRRPFVVKPNHRELGDLFGESADTEDDVLRLAGRLRDMGAQNVLVSRAENGAILLDEMGGVHTVGIVRGECVNSVGCGDAMLAGFLAGYKATGDYAHALRLGAACGNATAFCEGLATSEEMIRKLFNEL